MSVVSKGKQHKKQEEEKKRKSRLINRRVLCAKKSKVEKQAYCAVLTYLLDVAVLPSHNYRSKPFHYFTIIIKESELQI